MSIQQPSLLNQKTSEVKLHSLILFFTHGVSLSDWENTGYLQREVAYYTHLVKHIGPITFLTYGDESDFSLLDKLNGIRVIPNTDRLTSVAFLRQLPKQYPDIFTESAIYKSNQIKGAQAALDAASVTGGKAIVRCGYLLSRFKSNTQISMRMKFGLWRREMSLFHSADKVFLPTEEDALYARRWYALSSDKVAIMPNFVDTTLFAPRDDVACEPGLIGFVGRLAPQKNLPSLIQAMEGLKGAKLRLIGDGPQYGELNELAKQLKIDVEFLGNVPHADLPRLLAECEIFVLPSFYEGLPKALLEAMAAGLPVVATKVQGSGALIRHRQTGWLCDDPTPQALRSALSTLLENSVLRAQIAKTARRYVEENYSLDQVLMKEVAIYRELGIG